MKAESKDKSIKVVSKEDSSKSKVKETPGKS
jgi:hypothetical protein